jgi:hypothetical protein
MKKKAARKLQLSRETLLALTSEDWRKVLGGVLAPSSTTNEVCLCNSKSCQC